LLLTGVGEAPGGPDAGDQLLAAAASYEGLTSYTVPVHFQVHLQKPIGTRAAVDGTAYFQSPDKGALVLDKAHGIIGQFFKGTYPIDLVPQAWPAKYHVLSVSQATENGVAVTLLTALPRVAGDDIQEVDFTIDDAGHAPIGATWLYKNKSSIQLTFTNGRSGAYTLPQAATVAVDMPKSKLTAVVTYDAYALDADVDPKVFEKK
jgi:hypothetical protein